jgi:SAM-dependent methyltransferase
MTAAPEPSFPLPPDLLLERVGKNPDARERVVDVWQTRGRRCHDVVISSLPGDWSFAGKTVLDFGCGAGRTLRYFGAEAEQAKEFWGCDVHPASIEWLDANLCPPFRVFCNATDPPLPLDDASVDVVYAISVFSHLTTNASAWLLELRRILRPGGCLIITYQGPGLWELRGDAHELPDLDSVGRTIWGEGKGFCEGTGPDNFMAAWWIREHWGRAFHIEALEEFGIPKPPIPDVHGRGQGIVVMRPNGRDCTAADIEAPNLAEPREVPGILADRALLVKELGYLRQQAIDAQAELASMQHSHSWRITAPVRAARRLLGRGVAGVRGSFNDRRD